jgi:hypothetical protein
MSCPYRPELEKLPSRLESLPVDRGYPVPYFAAWVKNEAGEEVPEFRAMDPAKWASCVRHHRCWVCGTQLGAHLAFVIGPMCGITRVTSEPPCHLDCALWSARNCPFLARPSMVRRDLEKDYPGALQPAGNHLDRNPGACMVYVCRDYSVFADGRGGYLIHLGELESYTFWAEGKPATRAQVEESVDSGVPLLIANDPKISLDDLRQNVTAFKRLLPSA